MLRKSSIIAMGTATGLLALAGLASFWFDPEDHGIALAPQSNVAVWDGSVWFYNEACPYRGSMIQIGDPPEPLLKCHAFDFPGAYYRYFQFPTHVTWSFRLSLWYPLVLSLAANPGVWRRVSSRQPRWDY